MNCRRLLRKTCYLFLMTQQHILLADTHINRLFSYNFNKFQTKTLLLPLCSRENKNKSNVLCIFKTNKQNYSSNEENVMTMRSGYLRKYVASILDDYQINQCEDYKEKQRLQELKDLHDSYLALEKEVQETEKLIAGLDKDKDVEMLELAAAELIQLHDELSATDNALVMKILPVEPLNHMDVIVDLQAGAGGQEAMLFAGEMLNMYENYANYNNWQCEVIKTDFSDEGGLRQAHLIMRGFNVYGTMRFEGGVHRVQRVPKTEAKGRMHTSTMAVAVMPLPSELEVKLDPKDLEISVMRSSGAGGQHVNKTNSAVRIVHLPTGIVAECQQTRTQVKNREIAMEMLRSRIYSKLMKEKNEAAKHNREQQVGSLERSDKIRTYNFQQGRVSDHRLEASVRGSVEYVMQGGDQLADIHAQLAKAQHQLKLKHLIETYTEQQQGANTTRTET